MSRLRAPTVESLFVAVLALFGFRVGVRPILDNSMLTHLRTGIDMASGAGIPRSDPYSYTAAGSPWVVQSWLPEWTYGWAHRLGGFRLVVLEQALLAGLLALLIANLARAGSARRTALAALAAVALGSPFWSPRPLLFGLIAMALTVTIVERRLTPWLLVPVVWMWVNSHGSFPLGLVWLGTRALGEGLDWKTWPRDTAQYAWVFVASLLVAAINPLGFRLLVFPFTAGDKREAFSHIIEWMSPDFQTARGRFGLVFLALAVLLLVRARTSWRDAVPVVAFLAGSLLAMRNLPVAAIVLAPALGRSLRRAEGAPRGPDPAVARLQRMNRSLAAALMAVAVTFGASVAFSEPLALRSYPEAAATFLDQRGYLDGDRRLAHQDAVGNYLTFRFGRSVKVFYDDRVDMYPSSMSADYFKLLRTGPEALAVLDRHGVDLVLWQRQGGLATLLQASGRWTDIYSDSRWVVFERRSSG